MLVVLCLLSLTACLKNDAIPKFEGRVIDAFSKETIAGADIEAFHYENDDATPGEVRLNLTGTTESNLNGAFGFDQDHPIARLEFMHRDYVNLSATLPPGNDLQLRDYEMVPAGWLRVTGEDTGTIQETFTGAIVSFTNDEVHFTGVNLLEGPKLYKMPMTQAELEYRLQIVNGTILLEQTFGSVTLSQQDTVHLHIEF